MKEMKKLVKCCGDLRDGWHSGSFLKVKGVKKCGVFRNAFAHARSCDSNSLGFDPIPKR